MSLESLVEAWPVDHAAVGVIGGGEQQVIGDAEWRVRIASVSKLLAGYAALVALEEESIDLNDPAGPEGATVGDLLAHVRPALLFELFAVVRLGLVLRHLVDGRQRRGAILFVELATVRVHAGEALLGALRRERDLAEVLLLLAFELTVMFGAARLKGQNEGSAKQRTAERWCR